MHVSKTAGSEKRLDKPDADVNRKITSGKSARRQQLFEGRVVDTNRTGE
jgi:hypothetical protein